MRKKFSASLLILSMIMSFFINVPVAFAATSVFNKAYITSYTTGVVDVVDLTTNTVEKGKISVGTNPNSAAINPNGTQVFVTNRGDNTVSVIDPTRDTVIKTISVGKQPHGVAFSAGGSKAYVANNGSDTLSIINTTTLSVTDTINIGSAPVAMVEIGNKLYVTLELDNKVSVVDMTNDTVTNSITVGSHPYGLSVNPDGTKIYVPNKASNSVSVINTSDNTVESTISVGSGPHCTEVTPDGSKVYVANAGGNSLSVIDTNTNTVIKTIAVGVNPYVVGIGADGKHAYSINYRSNSMSVINTETYQVEQNLSLSAGPFMVGTFMVPTAVAAAQNTYTVTYDGNGSTGGSSPIDSTSYTKGKSATVLGNTGKLERKGYTFAGWNTAADGSGTDYAADSSVIISGNVTLYAKWTANKGLNIVDVESIEDIYASNGIAKSDIGLPETINIKLSNSTTTSAAVSWDNGDPIYDGNTEGTYTFTGELQLPEGVVNTDSLKASVNVIVGSKNVTTGAAVSINGTAKAGNALKATVVDGNGNDLSSNAEYIWYRVASANGDGDKIGTGKTYVVRSSDVGYYIKLVVTYDSKTYEDVTSKVTKTTSSTSSSSSHKSSSSSSTASSSSSSEQIKVNVTDGTSATSVSQTVITRTTASDGAKTDTVTYTADKAKETIATLVSAGKDTARIVATDSDAAVAQTQVNIAKDTLSALSRGNVNLEIETNGAIVSVPKESVQALTKSGQLSGDLYFRVVPIKDAAKQEAIKTTADKEAAVKAVSGNSGVQVIGTPMTIETNISQRSVDIILPLTGITLPTDAAQRQAFLNDLGVFIEHSDGEKVLEKGKVVEYKAGVLGIKFAVNKFSDFTIVKLNQSIKAGWKLTDGYWYFIENDGTMAKGWHKSESGEWTYNGKDTVNTWFHLESDGKMDTGWFKDTDGLWYFLCDGKDYGALGVMETGWKYIDGNWYYFNSNGSMAGNTTIDGYTLNSSGALVN